MRDDPVSGIGQYTSARSFLFKKLLTSKTWLKETFNFVWWLFTFPYNAIYRKY